MLCRSVVKALDHCILSDCEKYIVYSQVSDGRIYTSCAVEGEVKVFELRDNKFHCIFASESIHNTTGVAVTLRHIRSLGVKGDNIFYGDDGVNLKILSWKKGKSCGLPQGSFKILFKT